MSCRIDKINELIREQASLAMHDIFIDRFISISSVKTSRDLSYCDITILSLKDQNETIKLIKKRSIDIQSKISEKISIRKMPKLRFHLDRTLDEADKIEKLLTYI